MNDAGYRKRLAADIPKWMDRGWVTPDGATGILGAVEGGRRMAFGFAAILGTLGALLLGLGILAFVAANWEEIPRIARMALLAAALLAAYVAAFEFDRRDLRVFSEAGILTAALVYAGAIALVGQSYHLSGSFDGAVLLFEIGVLGAALLTGSSMLATVGLVASGYWAWLGTIDNNVVPHWPSLVAIAAGAVVTITQNAHYGRIVAVLALMFWIGLALTGTADRNDWSAVGAAALSVNIALALWVAGVLLGGLARLPRLAAFGEALLWPSLLVLIVLVGIEQVIDKPSTGEAMLLAATLYLLAAVLVIAVVSFALRALSLVDLIAVAIVGGGAILFARTMPATELPHDIFGGVLVMVAALWAVYQGQAGTHRIGKAFGLTAFGAEIIYLYVTTLGTLLDTALSFLGGGVLFIVLATGLYQIDKRLARRAEALPEPAAAGPMAAPPPAPPSLPVAPPAEDTAATPGEDTP